MVSCNRSTLKRIDTAVRADVPVIVWGAPGTGKTASLVDHFTRQGYHVEVLVGSVREPSDFAGLPVVDTSSGGVSFSPPAWARRLEQADRALLFLDELTTCSAAVQAAMLRIIQERVAGDMALGEHVRIVAAANPPDQAVLGIDLDPPMLNRFTHVTWEIDLAAWGEWVLSQPSLAPDRAPEVRSKILGFLEFRPGLVVSVPEDPGTNQPWPSLRSWYGAMVQLEADPDDDAFVHDTLRGTVGEAAAVEFTAWSTESELPRPADVLADPKVVRWEELRPDQAFAVMTGLRGLLGARRRVARRDWEAAIRVLDVAAAAGRADVGVPLLRWLFERVPKDARIPASLKEHYLELLQMARLVPG